MRWPRIEAFAEAWVSRVSMNLALDGLRRQQRPWMPSALLTSGPEVGVPNAERLDLQRALLSLPRRQREVVALRYLADLPEQAVADVLKCSPGTVKQHASRGLAALRRSDAVALQEAWDH